MKFWHRTKGRHRPPPLVKIAILRLVITYDPFCLAPGQRGIGQRRELNRTPCTVAFRTEGEGRCRGKVCREGRKAGAECLALLLGQSRVTGCTTGNVVRWSSVRAGGVQQNNMTHVSLEV